MSKANLTVLYDGGCPLCRREIAHYQRLADGLSIDWVDVSDSQVNISHYGVTTEQAMRAFHVIDEHGQTHIGAEGFIRLWAALPFYRGLGWLCRTLHLTPLMNHIYARFAEWRYQRRCQEGLCSALRKNLGFKG